MDYPSFAEPEDVARLFMLAWNRRDAQKLASLFAEDAEFVNVVGLWWHDRAAIEKAHAYGLKKIFAESELSIRKLKVKQLHPTIAIVHARFHLKGQSPHTSVAQTQARQTVMSFVVQQSEGVWQCVSAHNTDIVPGKETHIIDASGNFSTVDYRGES